MAKAPKKVKKATEGWDPRSVSFVVTNDEWSEPVEETQDTVQPKVFTVVLRGKGKHVIGINGQNSEFIGGEEITVTENIYSILKDADIIEKEI